MYAIEWCSSPTCNHMARFWVGSVPENYCTECGSPMIKACPNCHSFRLDIKDKFCPKCGALYKIDENEDGKR